jgi:FMN phosphatase YigB (HAD superfamily)
MSLYKVIYFDVDGTLVDYESDACYSFGKASEHALHKYPHLAGRLTNDLFKRARESTYIQHGDTGIPLRDWYRECMRCALEALDLYDIELADQMGQLYGLFRNTTLQVYADVSESIPRLAGKYKLGLISNGSTRLQKLDIGAFFTYSVYAREVGHEKPSPDMLVTASIPISSVRKMQASKSCG